MKRGLLALVPLAALAGCGVAGGPVLGGPPLVSAQSPPAAESAHSEPQPLTSLPLGAANISSAPNATHPNYVSLGVRVF